MARAGHGRALGSGTWVWAHLNGPGRLYNGQALSCDAVSAQANARTSGRLHARRGNRGRLDGSGERTPFVKTQSAVPQHRRVHRGCRQGREA